MAYTPEKLPKQDYLFLAKTAERAELYEDMFYFSEQLVLAGPALTSEERSVFCSASKHVVGTLRNSLRALHEFRKHDKAPRAKEIYKTRIEKEISGFCGRVLNVVEVSLIPSAGDDKESMLNYLTMKGDFYRYMVEVKEGYERDTAAERAENAYVAAKEIAEKNFKPIDSYRLAVALNFSVFCYENLGDKKRAISMLKEAFDEASVDEGVSKGDYKNSFMIMGVMQENLFNWKISNHQLSRINN